MKTSTRHILAFIAAGAITAATWIACLPRSVAPPASPARQTEEPVVPTRWSKEKISLLIEAVGKAESDETKLDACTDLLQVPADDVREVLEQMNCKNGRSLSLAAKILLIRWAAKDGEAAVNWAWKRFRSEGLWEPAFREIGPAWAAHHPAGLGRWALSAAEKLTPDTKEPNLAEVGSMEHPFIDSGTLTDISRWLVTEDPHLAYQLIRRRGGFSSEDMKMPFALTSVAKIREALLVFDDVKISNPTKLSGNEIHVCYLLKRWHQLDADDFNRSPYAGSIVTNTVEESAAAVERWKELPADERAGEADSLVAGMVHEAKGWRISAIAEAWAESDAAAAVRWLDSLPPEDDLSANTARIKTLAPSDLTAALDWADGLPAEQRRNALVTAFDSWTKAHPGQRADGTGWSSARTQAWEDMESLDSPEGR